MRVFVHLKNIYNNIISKIHIIFITNDDNIIKTSKYKISFNII